jgi:NADH-quinone oxidoreductase subunit L
LLIGFWFKDMANAKAGKKAFIVNRVGDFGFIIGMMILALEVQRATGIMSLDFIEMKGAIAFLGNPANTLTFMGLSMVGVACAALFIGATGKSAQIPLYVWLPDAMAGPTPVSALIHAATMVTAGVYMIGRLNDFFLLVPNLLGIVAWVGALTALYAATIAITQFDIKKVLAYSTVSQLGYMFVAMGVGAFSTGIFHLVTHAFFKGLLFLAAGAVIHSLHEEQDIRKMGGLKKLTPITFWLFAAGWYAICALPFGSGYFSKDAILVHAANSANGGMALFAIALLTGGMTAFYMSRLFFLTFFGECRYKKPEDIHDSPISMTGPMGILALLSLVGGFINIPSWLSHSFAGTIPEAGHLSHGMVAGISTLFVFCGITLAWYLYLKKPALSASMAKKGHALHDFSGQAYYINELYGALFVKPALKLGEVLTRLVDKSMLDGVCIHGTASLVMKLGGLVTLLQSGRLTSYLLSLTLGTLFLLYFLIY